MLAMSDFVSDFDPGPGESLLQSGISLSMPNFAGVVDASQVPNFVSVSDPGPGKISPESGNMFAMSDIVGDFDPGPREPLLQSGVSLNMPNFAGDFDILHIPDFVSAIDPGPGATSPGSGDTLAVPNFSSVTLIQGPGSPCWSREIAWTCCISLVTANYYKYRTSWVALILGPGRPPRSTGIY